MTDEVKPGAGQERSEMAETPFSVNVYVTLDGGVLIVGWVNDMADPLVSVRLTARTWRVEFEGASLPRARRRDVEEEVAGGAIHEFGFAGLLFSGKPINPAERCRVELCLSSHAKGAVVVTPSCVSDHTLRDHILGHMAAAEYLGPPHVRAIAAFERQLGHEIMSLNLAVVHKIVASPYIETFGTPRSRLKGSVVVCLFGRAEYLFLQAALYSELSGIEDYEFIYVSNSPELSEIILEDARIASLLYDLSITVVILPGNAGFGAANNVAAKAARSSRILIVNPDVFPRDAGWARKHTDILATRPVSETLLFGASLFYDDGSLMHGGMHFELDRGVTAIEQKSVAWNLFRVEHYGKGAPPDHNPYMAARPVPAISGAFMSIDRAWFEKLGGFSIDYVFGHYEDADLCLKSIEGGVAPWMQELSLWHFEGQGSNRLAPHEGGSLVNRWIFSSRWGEQISNGLLGPAPTHPLLAFSDGPAQPSEGARKPLEVGAP